MKWLLGNKIKPSPSHIDADYGVFGDVEEHPTIVKVEKTGPFSNVTLDLKAVYDMPYVFPEPPHAEVLVEYGSPNTNKALHLGHLRNILIGDAVSGMLEYLGCDVQRVSLLNDRGLDVFKALALWMEPWKKPQDMKWDTFVGTLYTAYEIAGRDDAHDLQKRWEAGDPKVVLAHQEMVECVYLGHLQTYDLLELSEQEPVFESKLYLDGVEIVKTRDDVFTKEDDGSISYKGEKTVLRADGTSLYITQDIGVANSRANLPCYYVVGSPQQHHFKTLFSIMGEVNPEFEGTHLSYGMVELPDGKMKSREGRVVEVDALFDDLVSKATAKMWNQQRWAASPVAEAALKFHLLDFTFKSNIKFNPDEALSYEGRTGPYVLYTLARIDSLLEKMTVGEYDGQSEGLERELVLRMLEWPDVFTEISPHRITAWLFRVCKAFNSLYGNTTFVGNAREASLAALFQRVRNEVAEAFSILSMRVPDKIKL